MGRFPPGRAVTGVQLSSPSHISSFFFIQKHLSLRPCRLLLLCRNLNMFRKLSIKFYIWSKILKKKNYIIKYFLFIKYIKYFCMVQFEDTLCAVKQTLIKELITFPVGWLITSCFLCSLLSRHGAYLHCREARWRPERTVWRDHQALWA